MPNSHSYPGDPGLGRMFVYENEMVQYDLHPKTIKTFFTAVRENKIDVVDLILDKVDNKQKYGLVTMKMDINDLNLDRSGFFTNLNSPYGNATEIAKAYGHSSLQDKLKKIADAMPAPSGPGQQHK
jgi:hypothetical protein